ncbi:MAG TPA: NAD(P)-dependent oxidoreductase [Anditalea sp.]|nr:NAD(P)-dependent oxidoreductase [Anditalea sp.]
MKIGLIKENKKPYDKRVAFGPEQLATIAENAEGYFDFVVEPSSHRCFPESEYLENGVEVSADIEDCDILMGIKEVPIEFLIPNKTYFFFSHTTKKQEANRGMLQYILENNITLIDYEGIRDKNGRRLVAFGRWAGIVGAYNGLWTYGKKSGLFDLKRANECFDLQELNEELEKVILPPIKMVITGTGKVGKGVVEVLNKIKAKEVTPSDLISKYYEEPVFAVLSSEDYNRRKADGVYNREEFHNNPELYESDFLKYAEVSDILFAAAYWDPRAPKLFAAADLLTDDFNISVIADITCDIGGSIPTTIRSSSIADPVYDVERETLLEIAPFGSQHSISVMAIDNLPCELPRDASYDFGNQLMKHVIPELMLEESQLIENATIAKKGKLMPPYTYLEGYVNQISD